MYNLKFRLIILIFPVSLSHPVLKINAEVYTVEKGRLNNLFFVTPESIANLSRGKFLSLTLILLPFFFIAFLLFTLSKFSTCIPTRDLQSKGSWVKHL